MILLMKVKRRRRGGFTLVELLVVVFIISTLMNVALPLYVSTVTDANKKVCRANQQSILNSAMAWKTKNRAVDFTGLTISALNADLGSVPLCPSGGTYSIVFSGNVNDSNGNAVTIPTSGIGISCSFSTHRGFVPGQMSQ
jgi:type IV pilus assembly protein PilA